MTQINDGKVRCAWADVSPVMREYHDREWGVPTHDERELFELLVLESAQAGLSWAGILDRRDAYRRVYRQFDPAVVAAFGAAEIGAALHDAGIVRNRAKIEASVNNARRFLELQSRFGSFGAWLWAFVDGKPVRHAYRSPGEVPAQTATSRALSRELKRCGFRFLGPVICQSYLQAAGLFDDHLVTCFRHGAGGE